MKLNYLWRDTQPIDEIIITSHPVNKKQLLKAENWLNHESELVLINPLNNRKVKVFLSEIESIEAMGHLSRVYLTDQTEYFLQQRLKEAEALKLPNFARINQSAIINLTCIKSFEASDNAKLLLYTKGGKEYMVSRYYGKQIKERLV